MAPSTAFIEMAITFSLTSALCFFQRRHLLHDFRWHAHRNAPSRNVLGDDCTCRNCAALSNSDARQNHHMSSDPAVITNHDRLRVLDIVASRLYLRLVCGSHDRHVRPEHHRLSNGDKAAVQDCEVEVGVEAVNRSSASLARWLLCARCLFLPVAETNVASIVYSERRLNNDILSYVSQQLFQFDVSLGRNGVEGRIRILWEGIVVLVTPTPGLEARCVEFGSESVVAALDE
jgi:hypothetical protein